jgi:hypothetical protein
MKHVLHPLIEANRRRAQRRAPHAYALLEFVAGRVIDPELAKVVDFAVREVECALRYDHSRS